MSYGPARASAGPNGLIAIIIFYDASMTISSGRISVRVLLSAGCICLVVVALTHVAERFEVLPSMGWGLPNGPGHYLDLLSAISGPVLLLAAGIVRLLRSK